MQWRTSSTSRERIRGKLSSGFEGSGTIGIWNSSTGNRTQPTHQDDSGMKHVASGADRHAEQTSQVSHVAFPDSVESANPRLSSDFASPRGGFEGADLLLPPDVRRAPPSPCRKWSMPRRASGPAANKRLQRALVERQSIDIFETAEIGKAAGRGYGRDRRGVGPLQQFARVIQPHPVQKFRRRITAALLERPKQRESAIPLTSARSSSVIASCQFASMYASARRTCQGAESAGACSNR